MDSGAAAVPSAAQPEQESAPAEAMPIELGQEQLGRLKFSDFTEVDLNELLHPHETGLDVAVLGDVGLRTTWPIHETAGTAFAAGQLSVIANAELGSNFHALSEVAFETNTRNELSIDLERVHLRWSHEHFFVMAGRVHSPFDYWNVAYHHGTWPQLTITRPRFLDFEDKGGLLPVHGVGVYAAAFGNLFGGTSTALVGVSNGRGNTPDDLRIVTDNNAAKQILVNLHHETPSHLRFGVSGIYDVIAAASPEARPALPGVDITELIGSAHVVYMTQEWTVIVEGFDIEHHASNHTWRSLAGFGLVGYRIGIWTPYLRAEALKATGGLDPFYIPDPTAPDPRYLQKYVEGIAGLRIDVSANSALKAEYRALASVDAKLVNTVALNWSFAM